MALLSFAERSRIALISLKRRQRASRARILFSPLFRWRFGSWTTGRLLIVPQDLRTADPSFWRELEIGQLGLAGKVAALDGRSPFDVRPPDEGWARSLHGFGWLRHLEATGDAEANEVARRLMVEWTQRYRNGSGLPWDPAVMGRRIISILSHANYLLEGTDTATYEAITRSLSAQIVRLSAAWQDGPDGYPRLLALTSLVLAYLCVSGHERQLDTIEPVFAAELERQILDDGGHVSRNPAIPVELLLELLPARQCFAARGRRPPEELLRALADMVSFVRTMRLGDGRLARFNGVSAPSAAALATVLAYDDRLSVPVVSARTSGYVHLRCGATTVIADAASAPPFEFASEAQSGCLAFELSAGSRLLFVNGGTPGFGDEHWRAQSRATANHNTLCLADTSSAKLVRHAGLESLIGGAPIVGPNVIASEVDDMNGTRVWRAVHDGYLGRYGLLHERILCLSPSGALLRGTDRLSGSSVRLRLKTDLPFAIHFHLHPDVVCRLGLAPNMAELTTADGQTWRFEAEGADLSVEDSIYFADSSGPRRALQLVLRGATFGETDVRWQLQQRA